MRRGRASGEAAPASADHADRPPTLRTFVALELDPESRGALVECARELAALPDAPRPPVARWVPPENLHVTVKFLGNVERARVEPIAEALAVAAASTSLGVGGAGGEATGGVSWRRLTAFPREQRALVLVGELEADPRLHEIVERALTDIGVAREDRPWRPHVTFARLRTPRDLRAFCSTRCIAPLPPAARFVELVLYASTPGPAGSRYEPLFRAPSTQGRVAPLGNGRS